MTLQNKSTIQSLRLEPIHDMITMVFELVITVCISDTLLTCHLFLTDLYGRSTVMCG